MSAFAEPLPRDPAAAAALPVRDVAVDQPEHGNVRVWVDGVWAELVYADWTVSGIFTIRWPSGGCERVRFTGRQVDPLTLRHQPRDLSVLP